MSTPRVSDPAYGVRRLGFGVSGPHGTPLVARGVTENLIFKAFEHGVRLFDSAPTYGNGEAERRLGNALLRLPRLECIVSTKVGLYSSGPGRRERDFSADGVRRSIDASLSRLRVKKLDWLLLHGPGAEELSDDLFKVVEAEQYAGRVGLLGVAGRGPEIEAALETGLFTIFMAPIHSGLDTDYLIRLSKIRQSGAELIGIETMAPSMRKYPLPTGAGKIWRAARSVAGKDNLYGTSGKTPSEALVWALTEGGAHRVVTTTTHTGHLVENVRAAESVEPEA